MGAPNFDHGGASSTTAAAKCFFVPGAI